MYCYDCDKMVIPIIKKENNKYNAREIEVRVLEDVYYCPNCNLELIDEVFAESSYKVYNAYLHTFGLSFSDFKKIRKKLNLSLELFASILGWSKDKVIKYENAQSLPLTEELKVYRLLKDYTKEVIDLRLLMC